MLCIFLFTSQIDRFATSWPQAYFLYCRSSNCRTLVSFKLFCWWMVILSFTYNWFVKLLCLAGEQWERAWKGVSQTKVTTQTSRFREITLLYLRPGLIYFALLARRIIKLPCSCTFTTQNESWQWSFGRYQEHWCYVSVQSSIIINNKQMLNCQTK